ncbi:MAG: Asp-tRNA(Asn)/Glu-tRNA(Gln) amidotransferase subunit GatC [Actinomycetota bacterium]|nr:Asp-tRNA(Asn)/Glu-tRNA(Gln) amidotransferase subunit GatC [Actinomycetota bacterium]
MAITRKDVEHVARLARLQLSEEELDLFGDQLSKILDHAQRVTSLETDDVPPTSHAIALANVTRPDVVEPSIEQGAALANAPSEEASHFKVPRILEDEGQ